MVHWLEIGKSLFRNAAKYFYLNPMMSGTHKMVWQTLTFLQHLLQDF